MRAIRIKPVEFIGECPIGLSSDDEFEIKGMAIENRGGSNICFLALTQMPFAIWQLQGGSRFFSHATCPGCTSNLERENRVVFLLGQADKFELCEAISGYLRLRKQRVETERAKELVREALGHQDKGEFEEALQKTLLALEELRRRVTS